MIDVPVYNTGGDQLETVQLDEQLLGGEIRPGLLKQAFVMYHANRRQGSARKRSRAEKRGSGSKMYRQKGTGRARHGSVRAPLMRGGGVTFNRHPRSWRERMPRKMRRLVTRNALLAKAVDGEVKVVDGFNLEAPKTRLFAQILDGLGIDRSCLVALRSEDETSRRAIRNLADVSSIPVSDLNVYDLLTRRYLLVEKDALLGWIEKQKALPGARTEVS